MLRNSLMVAGTFYLRVRGHLSHFFLFIYLFIPLTF
jgi:hypothetical protein